METTTIRTQVLLDKEILEQALQITHLKSKRELLDYALRELIRHEKQKKLLDLKGAICWEGDLSAMRENEVL
ncbi:MAG: type II toxin-antitoxin system VapB family antitoxin [Methylococcales bacterium]